MEKVKFLYKWFIFISTHVKINHILYHLKLHSIINHLIDSPTYSKTFSIISIVEKKKSIKDIDDQDV